MNGIQENGLNETSVSRGFQFAKSRKKWNNQKKELIIPWTI
jgi:hypothetical protein